MSGIHLQLPKLEIIQILNQRYLELSIPTPFPPEKKEPFV